MKRATTLALGLIGLGALTGCPASTDRPLAEPQPDLLDDRLIGTWIGEEDDDTYGILVVPFHGSEYYAEITDDDEPGRFRVYLFAAGEERFLHVEELSEDRESPEYVFARYDLPDPDHLTVRFVGEELVPDDVEPAALLDFLARNADDPALYDGDDTLVLRRK